MFSSSQIRIPAIPCWLLELGIWRELNTGKSFCTEVTYQKQVALLSMRMQQTNSQRSGIFATESNPPSKPVLASTWVAGIAVKTPGSQMWNKLQGLCSYIPPYYWEQNKLGDGGLLKVIIVWLYIKKMCLILKSLQFLEVSQPREVTLIIRLIYFNSLNQKYWLNEKLTCVELQMSFGFRFPEWYNY